MNNHFFLLEQQANEWSYYVIDSKHSVQNMILKNISKYLKESKTKFWFMRKSFENPHLRVRIKNVNDFNPSDFESKILSQNNKYKKLIYEPEIFLFGGNFGIEIAHDYFCLITNLLIEFEEHDGRAELFNILIVWLTDYFIKNTLQDNFEVWDCWNRIYTLREFNRENFAHILDKNKAGIEEVIGYSYIDFSKIFKVDFSDYLDELKNDTDNLIAKFQKYHFNGNLDRGIRILLSFIVIFSWNILDVKPGLQGGISAILSDIYEP